jgi:hypothetical protein
MYVSVSEIILPLEEVSNQTLYAPIFCRDWEWEGEKHRTEQSSITHNCTLKYCHSICAFRYSLSFHWLRLYSGK